MQQNGVDNHLAGPYGAAMQKTDSSPKTDSLPNPFTSFDPMAAWTASQQAFQKLLTDAQGRAQSLADEYAALEAQMIARARQAIETWAQLAQDALSYSAQLTAQARKLGLDAARKINA
jgi:hypothetical protein